MSSSPSVFIHLFILTVSNLKFVPLISINFPVSHLSHHGLPNHPLQDLRTRLRNRLSQIKALRLSLSRWGRFLQQLGLRYPLGWHEASRKILAGWLQLARPREIVEWVTSIHDYDWDWWIWRVWDAFCASEGAGGECAVVVLSWLWVCPSDQRESMMGFWWNLGTFSWNWADIF